MDQELGLISHETERGLLDLSVELSSRDITAGNQFTLFVLVRNPFNKPVWIRRVHVSLPSELKQADPAELSKKDQKKKREEEQYAKEILGNNLDEKTKAEHKHREFIDEKKIKLEAKISIIEKRLERVLAEFDSNASDVRERHLNKLESLLQNLRREIEGLSMQESNSNYLNMSGEPKIGMLRIDSKSGGYTNISGEPKIGYLEVYSSDQVLNKTRQTSTIELESSLPSYAALQSGSTAVYTAVLYVKNSIIFTPSQYRLQFNVNYSFNSLEQRKISKINQAQSDDTITQEIFNNNNSLEREEALFTNTVAHEISIRPSVYSIMFGSTIGGSVGSLARLLQTNPSLSWASFTNIDFLVGISVSIILSAVAIVFMARKSDTQAFLSVEDFWGGVLIGFLIGYTGASFFQELTGVASPSA